MAVCVYSNAYSQFIFTKQANTNYNFKGVYEEPITNNLLISNVTSTVTSSYLNYRTNIFRINTSGALLDSIVLDSNLIANGPVFKNGSNYFVTGGKLKSTNTSSLVLYPVIYKYDLNFNLIKQANLDSYSNDWSYLGNVIVKQNRLYAVFFLNTAQVIKVFKLDMNLNKLDSLTFNGLYDTHLSNYGDHILLAGGGFPMGSTFGNNQVLELDTNFNAISRFNLDSLTSVNPGCLQKVGMTYYHTNVYEVSPTKYIVSGFYPVNYNSSCTNDHQNVNAVIKNNSQVVKGSQSGQQGGIDDLYSVPITSSSKKYHYIFTVATNGYSLTNPGPPQTNTTRILVNKVDTSGNVIWTNYYGTTNYYYSPLGVCGTVDSGVVITGIRYNLVSPVVTNICEGFVMKLDKNGVQQYLGVAEASGLKTNYIKCFPNPANETLYFDLPLQENFTIEIQDISGRIILKEDYYHHQSGLLISLLTSGTYFYKLKSDKTNRSGKFIKE